MSELVLTAQSQRLGELVRSFAVHRSEHVCNGSCRIGSKRQVHEIVHGLHILQRCLLSNLQIELRRINLWLGNIQPLLTSNHPLLYVAHRGQVLVILFLILLAQFVAKKLGLIHHSIQQACLSLEAPTPFGDRSPVNSEEAIEYLLRLVQARNRLARLSEGKRLGARRHADAPITG